MTMFQTWQTRMRQHSAYRRTKHEIEAMPLDIALDLDIDRADARGIAARAVYGR